ncbi:MAG: molecular chaperone HtpG [Saprospiraceae bacterium]|nr:molecular chaperone HtpG [Saprospiraceae bacterium]MBK9689358.1 molecular chaperone HtpG [Saprospiraceae bacterium]MBL0084292.1 molecular chaperone HtpG [Saprospiraceae bacterium]
MAKGQISVQTENIFPIIKKFLYSDHEIFLRELVSNAVDATTKIKALATSGEPTGDVNDVRIEIKLDKEAKTLTISDKGLGMSQEEVEKYLNQVAFSSAEEFIEKYKDQSIIGHFGLGFYSAFMVADKVEVITQSYRPGEAAVRWICDGNPEYEMEAAERSGRGTDIILHINAESAEFLEEARIEGLLTKYCKFLPVEIQFGTRTESTWEGEGDDKKEIKTEVANIVNNPNPLWKKKPTEITDEEYKAFYNELYPYSQPPLFWIHLNIDYPFNLTGILYFPKLNNTPELQKNKIQLYSNQVYVTDEVKDIVPEFLTLLHGVIDSPDIPLNVSRSYLQADGNVKKITNYITKKVAEKLESLFKKERETFEQRWSETGVFVKYGMISDEKFNEKAIKFVLLKNSEDKYFTIEEYKEKIKPLQTDKQDRLVCIYANNVKEQYSFIESAKSYGYDVLIFDSMIDNHFMQHLEFKGEKLTFVRVDSDTVDNLVQKDEKKESILSDDQQKEVETLFKACLGDQKGGHVELKALSPDDHPVMITKPEFMRRMKEMQMMQGMDNDMFGDIHNVVVNTNHPLIANKLLAEKKEKQEEMVSYLHHLALLQQNMLKGEELARFVKESLNRLS